MSQIRNEQAKLDKEKTHEWGQRGTAGVSFASAVSFEKVDVSLGGKKILNQLDLNLKPGEITCLLGESGSGKSTILRVVAGLQEIQAGSLKINNEIASSAKYILPPQKRGVGLMFQDFALFPHLSLFDNVMFGLAHLSREEAKRQANVALLRVGLKGREGDFPHMLSGGQQQRLALARTIAPRPGIIMLDEPFSGLDSRLRESVRAETLAVLRETNATTIIVTHDPEEAMVMGDRIIMLRDGHVVQSDSAKNVYEKPIDLETARFLSPLNEIPSIVKSGYANTPLGSVFARGLAENTPVIVAIRTTGAIEMRASEGIYNKKDIVIGRVVTKRNALGIDICEVQIAGIDRPIHVRARANSEVKVGNNVFLSLNCQHVLVFDQK